MAAEDDLIFPPNIPEEMREQIRQHTAKSEMENEVQAHALLDLYHRLSDEDLLILVRGFGTFISEPRHILSHHGLLNGLLSARSICPVCEARHEDLVK